MSTTLPNMSLVQPTPGGDSGTWDDTLNSDLALVDAHDHSTGKGVRVPVAGININADLSLGSSWGLTNAQRIMFASTASSANNLALFVSNGSGGLTANELYWKSNAGTNVKVTNAGALNVSAFTGGIGGDYTSVSAEVAYDDANDRYTFEQGASTNWARIACGDLDLYETGTTDSVRVRLSAPSALGSSYTITFPTAVPSTTTQMHMDSSGNVSVSGATFLAGVITPPTITGANNNYAPTGFATATVLRITSNAGTDTITGIAGGAAGRVITLINVGVAADFILVHESASSTAANRILLPNGSNVTLRIQSGSATLWYDGSSSRWRMIGQP